MAGELMEPFDEIVSEDDEASLSFIQVHVLLT